MTTEDHAAVRRGTETLRLSGKTGAPGVTVIIPCCNGEKYLPAFFDSLLLQDYAPVEILFADDGSTDRTGEICREYARKFPANWSFRYFRLPHAGQAAAVSAVLKEITGEFLMWSDADDLMLPGSISRKARFLAEHPEYGMVRHDFSFFREDGTQKKGYRSKCLKGERIFEQLFDSTMPCHAGTYMMRTELLFRCYPDKTIPFSEEGQNLQLLLPPASRSRCAFLDELLMQYRIHPDSHSRKDRSLSRQLKRAQGFRDLRQQLLPYCDCDRTYFSALADRLFDRQRNELVKALASSIRTGGQKP